MVDQGCGKRGSATDRGGLVATRSVRTRAGPAQGGDVNIGSRKTVSWVQSTRESERAGCVVGCGKHIVAEGAPCADNEHLRGRHLPHRASDGRLDQASARSTIWDERSREGCRSTKKALAAVQCTAPPTSTAGVQERAPQWTSKSVVDLFPHAGWDAPRERQ
eukprot:IDg9979t1